MLKFYYLATLRRNTDLCTALIPSSRFWQMYTKWSIPQLRRDATSWACCESGNHHACISFAQSAASGEVGSPTNTSRYLVGVVRVVRNEVVRWRSGEGVVIDCVVHGRLVG